MAIFGYMNFMIFMKWFLYSWENSAVAPSVLITLINMFMMKTPSDTDPGYLKEKLFEGQFEVQTGLILLALVCIPWMLIIKPFADSAAAKRKARMSSHLETVETSNGESMEMKPKLANGGEGAEPSTSNNDGHGHGEFSLGDAFINQAIHTIEYCLGSVSHTASYLRLWALSLAHAQLSEVLWNMVMKNIFMCKY